MKVFLALRVRKSISKELIFAYGFLNLVDFGFFRLGQIYNSWQIFDSSTNSINFDCTLLFSLVLWASFLVNLAVVQSIEVSGIAILLKFRINFL